jgi:hypothetical protein
VARLKPATDKVAMNLGIYRFIIQVLDMGACPNFYRAHFSGAERHCRRLARITVLGKEVKTS